MLKRIAGAINNQTELRVGGLLSGVAMVLSVACGTAVGAYVGSLSSISARLSLLLFVVAVVGGMYGAQAFHELRGWLVQRGRDLVAADVWSALRAGRPPPHPFTLYLRPFASTDAIGAEVDRLVRVRSIGQGGGVLAMASDRLELEAEVELAMRPIGPLIALGAPLEHIGAGRILVSDERWRQAVETLMDAARLIVLLPSSRPGTTWEVQTLLSAGRLAKTIVVDPPDDLGEPHDDYDPSSEWQDVRRSFAAFGFELPQDDPDGLLLYFGNRRRPMRVEKMSSNAAASVRTFAESVLKDLEMLNASA